MKRMKVLFGNRRMMVLLTLAILVLAATALVASSASFTAQKANAGNVFTAGNLDITSIPASGTDGGVILTANHLVPGYLGSSVVHVSNTGDVTGHFTMETATSHSTTRSLSDRLTLTIQEVADIAGNPMTTPPAPVYSGAMNAITTRNLLNWTGGTGHFYKFTVNWDNSGAGTTAQDDADSLYKGADCTAVFTWKAASL